MLLFLTTLSLSLAYSYIYVFIENAITEAAIEKFFLDNIFFDSSWAVSNVFLFY